MLSLFPSLLSFEQVSPFILRLTLGAIFLFWAYKRYGDRKNAKDMALSILEKIIGILLIIGFYAQLSALVAAIILLARLITKIKNKMFFSDGVNYYFILLVISLSILLTGPGIWAFDLAL